MQNLTFELTYFIIGLVFLTIGFYMAKEVINKPESFSNKKLVFYSILSFLAGVILILMSHVW